MIIEDFRGDACPLPVIRTKKALENSGGAPVKVIVDNGPPRENVNRFAKSAGYQVLEQELDHGWQLTLVREGEPTPRSSAATEPSGSTILIDSDKMGDGPDELGLLLMKNFMITLLDIPARPETIFFLNRGVLLTVAGSEVLEPLRNLAAAGTEIRSCGVCLDYFGVREKLAVGSVTTMFAIADKLLTTGSPVRI